MNQTTTNVINVLSFAVVAAGIVMEILDMHGGMLILLLGFTIGTAVSFTDGMKKTKRLKELEEQSNEKSSLYKNIFSILFGLASGAVLLGAMMKIFHFEGAVPLLISGIGVGAFMNIFDSIRRANRIKELEEQLASK